MTRLAEWWDAKSPAEQVVWLENLWWRYRPSAMRARLWRWFREPFVTHVDIYEHTRVEHRGFPAKLKIQRIESMQERVDRGGVVIAPVGRIHITEPIRLGVDGTSLYGAVILGHGATSAIEISCDGAGLENLRLSS